MILLVGSENDRSEVERRQWASGRSRRWWRRLRDTGP